MTICHDYVGVACIDGTCPKANSEEYAERDIPVVRRCSDCHFYRGCSDCYFGGHGMCKNKQLRNPLFVE